MKSFQWLSVCLYLCVSLCVSLFLTLSVPLSHLCVSVCLSPCTDTCKNMCTHPFVHIQRPKHNVGVFLYHTAHCDEAGSLTKPEPHHLGSACWPATLSIHPSLLSSRTAGLNSHVWLFTWFGGLSSSGSHVCRENTPTYNHLSSPQLVWFCFVLFGVTLFKVK